MSPSAADFLLRGRTGQNTMGSLRQGDWGLWAEPWLGGSDAGTEPAAPEILLGPTCVFCLMLRCAHAAEVPGSQAKNNGRELCEPDSSQRLYWGGDI